MMRKITTLGAAGLLVVAGLIGGAAPAGASTTDLCSNPTFSTTCELLQRNAEHIQQELDRVPGYVDEVQDKAVQVYDTVTLIVRCLISDDC
jgi:hypothetical protein